MEDIFPRLDLSTVLEEQRGSGLVTSGSSLVFADDVVLLVISDHDRQKSKVAAMRIRTSRSETMVLSQMRVDGPLLVQGFMSISWCCS